MAQVQLFLPVPQFPKIGYYGGRCVLVGGNPSKPTVCGFSLTPIIYRLFIMS